jgi:hypothetical protein
MGLRALERIGRSISMKTGGQALLRTGYDFEGFDRMQLGRSLLGLAVCHMIYMVWSGNLA